MFIDFLEREKKREKYQSIVGVGMTFQPNEPKCCLNKEIFFKRSGNKNQRRFGIS